MSKFILSKNLNKPLRNLPSQTYHGLVGTWSSSQLKDIIEDEEYFIDKYIKKEIPREEKEVFDTGSYFHTLVLEPHKVKEEVAFFSGKVRHGNAWEVFKKKNAGKIIISSRQKEDGDNLAKAVNKSPVSLEYLEGVPEVSLFIKLTIMDGVIYANDFGKMLTPNGWKDSKVVAKGKDLIIKVRADTLGSTFISDLKSTTGSAKSQGIRGSISKYRYDLSAALYLDMFSLVYPRVRSFVWIFASKDKRNAASWVASNKNILVGRRKWMKAVTRIAELEQNDWKVKDILREAEPLPYELEWLEEKETDLL